MRHGCLPSYAHCLGCSPLVIHDPIEPTLMGLCRPEDNKQITPVISESSANFIEGLVSWLHICCPSL